MPRKYSSYTLHADYGQVMEQFENYKEAYSAFCKQVRYHNPATLYGLDYDGNVHVIHSR